MPGTITLIDPQGVARDVPTEAAGAALEQPGWRVQTEDDRLGRISTQAKEVDYGGVAGGVAAGAAGLARGVTLGGSDVALRALGGDDAAFDLSALREVNPGISTGSEIVGAVAPALLTGGASTPAGAVARMGRGITKLGEGAGALGKIAASGVAGTAEGTLYGLGAGVSELALSDEPLTVEHVVSTLSSNALFGASVGGLAGGAGRAAELGLARAKGAIDDVLARRQAAKAATPEEAIRSGDLGSIDKRILDTAQKSELERIAQEQAPQRKALTDELDGWRKANRDAHDIRTIAKASGDPNLREAGGAFDRANLKLRAALDDKIGFAEDPLRSIKAVRTQAQALEDMRIAARGQEQQWREAVDTARDRFRADIEAISSKPTLAERTAEGRARGLADYTGPFTPAGLENAADRAVKEYSGYQWGGAIRNGLKAPSIVTRIPAIESMIDANQKLLGQLDALAKPPTSELLTKIDEARAVLDVPKVPSLGAAAFNAVVPFAGPLGAIAATSKRAIGGLRAAAGKAAVRAGKAASTFLDVTGKAVGKAAPRAPVVASKVLAALSYAPPSPVVRAVARAAAPKLSPLAAAFHARTDEIKSQVQIAPDGSFQVRPAARERIATTFDGIRAADPRAADQMETLATRRLAYLASIIPRLPDYGTVQIGPERRTVPDQAMRTFARAAGALEDPDGVFERAAHGTIIPDEVAAVRAVYPEKLSDFTQQLIESLPTLPRNLPYKRRLSLSILTGVPIDPAMTPSVLGVIQGMYAAEPGTQGGTQAPTPQPQFGSVRADKGTQAQQRQGENT